MECYWVFDFQRAAAPRWVTKEPPERLEHYAFEKRRDGSYALAVQVGWPGGTGHWDGAGNSFPLPSAWFDGGWEAFLDRLTEAYPKRSYGYGKDELLPMTGLKEFLGF